LLEPVAWKAGTAGSERAPAQQCAGATRRDLLLDHATQGPDPNDFIDLAEVERRLLGFQRRYEQTAVSFDWRFTRADLHDLLRRLDEKEQLAKAA
jgi:hypothetical protein